MIPTCRPTTSPSQYPTTTSKPTYSPTTYKPSADPTTWLPSEIPTFCPTQPSASPTCRPTMAPTTSKPSYIPTTSTPSATPTCRPSMAPTTSKPSFIPTTSTPSVAPTFCPTIAPTTSKPSYIPTTSTPSASPTCSPTQPSATPTCRPSMDPTTSKPSYIPTTSTPSATPTCRPTMDPTTSKPSYSPTTSTPSASPTCSPTQPSANPTCRPTMSPTTSKPSYIPTTSTPSAAPTCRPSQPSATPTFRPTFTPTTFKPSSIPTTSKPSAIPTYSPTHPTASPTCRPTLTPSTFKPSVIPTTSKPSAAPTFRPTMTPTTWKPTFIPTTSNPSLIPTIRPTAVPTNKPSAPTTTPSCKPTYTPTIRPSYTITIAPTGYANCPGGTYIVRFPTYYSCSLCDVGYYSNANYTSCQACPINFYSDNRGSSSCLPCPSGSVTGVSATTSSAGCVNPTTNFVLGLLSLGAGAIIVALYINFSRMPAIAIERRLWMVDKCFAIYSIVLSLITKTHRVCSIMASKLAKIRQAKEEEILKQSGYCSLTYLWIIFKRILKPIIFLIVVTLVAIIVITATLVSAIYHVLFNALLLFRGYKLYFHMDFVFLDRISAFISEIGIVFKLDFIVSYISYPLLYVLNLLSNLSIDLTQFNVTCTGSQAPVYLLLDCLLVAIVILSIVSDVHIFWSTILKKTTMHYGQLLFNRYYFSSVCSSPVRILFTLVSFLLNLLCPSPMKVNQYLLSFVSVSAFFSNNGMSGSSSNCDSALGFPIDTAEAFLTSAIVYSVIHPIVYMFAQILYPSPLSCFESRAATESSGYDEGFYKKVVIAWRSVTALTSVDWFLMKMLFNFARSLKNNLDTFTSALRQRNLDDEELRTVLEDPLEQEHLPVTKWLHVFNYINPDSTAEVQQVNTTLQSWQDEYPSYYTAFLNILEDISISSRSIRWNLKFIATICGYWFFPIQICISSFAREMWWDILMHYAKFLCMSFGIWFPFMVEDLSLPKNFEEFEIRINQRGNPRDATLNPLFGENAYARLPNGDEDNLDAVSGSRLKLIALKFHSKEQRDSVLATLSTILTDFTGSNNAPRGSDHHIEDGTVSASTSSDPAAVPTTSVSTQTELRTVHSQHGSGLNWNPYSGVHKGMMLKLDTSRDLLIFERRGFSLFQSSGYIAPIRLSDMVEVVSGDKADASAQSPELKLTIVVKTTHFVDIDAYDRKHRFLEYLAAMTSCRTVMWQLIPFMTGLAILSVDTASCPVFVFSRELNSMLTDLVVWNAWGVAKERIRKENRGKKLVSWQIALFMVYIFVEESRLVQFIVAMTINFVAYCLIFKTSYLYFVIRGFLLMMVLIGFVRVGYTVVPLYKFFFPQR
eukprot:gene24997-33501_t